MDLIEIYRKIIGKSEKGWVLFNNGTCVMPMQPEIEDIKMLAIKILREHGRVIVGTPSGDFDVIKVSEVHGWIVTGDYPGIMIFVSEEEAGKKNSDIEVGLIGRTIRANDAKELKVVHVEIKKL